MFGSPAPLFNWYGIPSYTQDDIEVSGQLVHTHPHTHKGPISLSGPLKWVIIRPNDCLFTYDTECAGTMMFRSGSKTDG